MIRKLIVALCLASVAVGAFAAQQVINVGTTPGDGTGDKGNVAFGKVNANFSELYDPAHSQSCPAGPCYDYTTIPQTIAAGTILGNSTGSAAAPQQLASLPSALDISNTTAIAANAVTARTIAARAGELINVKDYGALGNYVTAGTCTISSGSGALNCPSAAFVSGDIGKHVMIPGAGSAGVALDTAITGFSDSHNVIVNPTASTTASSVSSNYGTDDSSAINAAIVKFNALAVVGTQSCVYFPAAIYFVGTTSLSAFKNAACALGTGPDASVLVVSPNYSGGYLLESSEAWLSTSYPQQGPTVVSPSVDRSSPLFTGLSIVGWTTGTAFDAIVLANRNDDGNIANIKVSYVPGRAIYIGKLDTVALPAATLAYTRESRFYNINITGCGSASAPAMELTSYGTGAGDVSNQLSFYALNIVWPQGEGLVIRNRQTAKGITNIRFYGLRIEGVLAPSPAINGDLLRIGDTSATYSGGINNIEIYGSVFNTAYNTYNSIGFYQPAGVGAAQPFNITIQGTITSSNTGANGINIQSGRRLRFAFEDLALSGGGGTPITVASSTTVGSGIVFDMNGVEQTLASTVDATSFRFIGVPLFVYGQPGNVSTQAPAVLAVPHGTSAANNAGPGAVDLQIVRGAATQVSTGTNSVIGGGTGNTNGALNGVISGGNGNSSSGTDTTVVGGDHASDRARFGGMFYASGRFSVSGDAQLAENILRGTGSSTSAIRVTADASAAGAANCVNIPNNAAYALNIEIVAFDHTTITKFASWNDLTGLMTRGANAASTALAVVSGTPAVTFSGGTLTGNAMSLTADTTQGCLNISWTPPTANTDTWNVVARVRTVEVQ